MRQAININIHDAAIGIWQKAPDDPSFRSEVYGECIRRMRSRGWAIRHDSETRHRFPSLSPNQRVGARGTLRCSIRLTGRVVEIEFWSTTAPQINRYGRQYDFDKMTRMSKIDRLRVQLEFRRIVSWLETIAPVKVKRHEDRDMPAMARIQKGYAENWQSDKALGRPVCSSDYNRKSKDGALLEQGQTVWLADRKGRIIRGKAFYNINNMWWVIAGGALFNEGSHSLYATQPDDLRTKRNELALSVRQPWDRRRS